MSTPRRCPHAYLGLHGLPFDSRAILVQAAPVPIIEVARQALHEPDQGQLNVRGVVISKLTDTLSDAIDVVPMLVGPAPRQRLEDELHDALPQHMYHSAAISSTSMRSSPAETAWFRNTKVNRGSRNVKKPQVKSSQRKGKQLADPFSVQNLPLSKRIWFTHGGDPGASSSRSRAERNLRTRTFRTKTRQAHAKHRGRLLINTKMVPRESDYRMNLYQL